MSEQSSITKPPQVTRTEVVRGHYTGEGGALFAIAGVASVLTLLTLGIYRFWGKTRIRRYIWSSTTVQGDPFQYTGNGLEKLLGFLIAVIVLAFALGIIQIGLFYFNLSFFSPTQDEYAFETQFAAAQASLIFLAPLFFFARYRSLRYKLARTRWRGIRCAMENAAWGYAWRAVLLSLLTIVTLGLMLPYQTYKMAKYRTDRTWFGNTRFELNGRWQSLYRSMMPLFFGAVLLAAAGALIWYNSSASLDAASSPVGMVEAMIWTIVLIFVAAFWLFVSFTYFRVDSFRRLVAMTSLGDEVEFSAHLSAPGVIWRIIWAGLVISFVYGTILGVTTQVMFANFDLTEEIGGVNPALAVANFVAVIIALLLISALSITMIVQPIIRNVVNGLTITNPGAIERIRQRSEAEQVDADGLADALDFGGAI